MLLFKLYLHTTIFLTLTSSPSFAQTTPQTVTVNTECDRCLNIRDNNLNITGRTIEKGTTLVVAGAEVNGYTPVYRQGQSDQIFYLYTRFLAPGGTQEGATPPTTDNTSGSFIASMAQGLTTAAGTLATFPARAAEAVRKLWVFQRLQHWIAQRGQALLNTVPQDIAQYCPNYSQLSTSQKINFWATLMTEVVKPESNYSTTATYRESFANSRGERVVSTGLFQLSLESARGYGCPINSQADLTDPDKNIMCAVTIMSRWVPRDNAIAQGGGRRNPGGARYWSVFRRSSTRNTFQQATRSYCQSPAQTPELPEDASGQPAAVSM